ncbi:MAG: RNA methyltransferase [Chloroflexi bacterium]|nr:RNA methyltransferase [Chloroflexota bacterium]
MITSTQNPKLKLVRGLLGGPKERRETGAFVIEGVRLVEEAVRAEWSMRFVIYDETLSARGRSQVEGLKSRGVEVEMVSASLMQLLSETETSQGILAVLSLTNLPIPNLPTFILIPDQIRDPGNLGTLLRTAAAAGVQAVLIPPETTDPFAPKVVRAGMGAHFRLPIISLAWEEIRRISDSAKLKVFLADMDGRSCWETDFRAPLALIVGGEAEGASQEARKLANQQVRIPMPGGAESLNAAIAGGILIFEIVRQRTEPRSHP